MKLYPVKYRGEIHFVSVDDEDAQKLDRLLNSVVYSRKGNKTIKKRKLSYVPAWKNRGFRPAVWFEGKLVYLSRWILGLTDSAVSHLIVDHIDQNPLNNRRENLRIVDRRVNALNSIPKREGKYSSKYKGVSWSKQCQRWRAWVKVGKNTISRFFKTEEEAYQERLRLEEKYYKPLMEKMNEPIKQN